MEMLSLADRSSCPKTGAKDLGARRFEDVLPPREFIKHLTFIL